MALVFKPVARSTKQFNFRLKPIPKKDELLSQRTDEKQDLSYIDLLITMLYVDANNDSSLKNLLRNILFALSQKYTNEEVMEILSIGPGRYFKAENFMETIEDSSETSNYIDMIKSLSDNSTVYCELVGDLGLFADKEEIDMVFRAPLLEKIKNVEKKPVESFDTEAKPAPDETDREERENEAGEKTDASLQGKPSKSNEAKTKNDRLEDRINKIKSQFEDIETSNMTKAFINSIIQIGEMEAVPQEDIGDYIATMLHGMGFVIPTINEEEIEEMTQYLENYMNIHTERIIQQQNEQFERE